MLRYAVESQYVDLTRLNAKGLEPFEYLEFAKSDLVSGSRQAPINALSNAKRAIHLVIDKVLWIWGLSNAYRKANFPMKLQALQKIDAFPTRLLENMNRILNLVEHEYQDVSYNDAADFIDVCEMFLLLAYPILRHAVVAAFVGLDDDHRCIEWELSPLKNTITTFSIDNSNYKDTETPLNK